MKLYPASNVHGVSIGEHHHDRPLVKGSDGKKVLDDQWGLDCIDCEPHLKKMGWATSHLERPMNSDEKSAAEAAEKRAHLTMAQSTNLMAEVMAKMLSGEIKPGARG